MAARFAEIGWNDRDLAYVTRLHHQHITGPQIYPRSISVPLRSDKEVTTVEVDFTAFDVHALDVGHTLILVSTVT
jgi:hypothetical protein